METKKPTGTLPTLGKVALKKIAAPAVTSAPVLVRRVVVAEADDIVRNALLASLPRDRFQIFAFADGDAAFEHIGQSGADVVVLAKELPGVKGTVLSELLRNGRSGKALAIVLMSPEYAVTALGARDCAAFGADEFLPLPTTPDALLERIDHALVRREPIERLKALPAQLARQLDELFLTLDGLSYYELLEVGLEAESDEIQLAFHTRSLAYHPDRHQKLRRTLPHAWEKVSTVFKRFNEAYQVLSTPADRQAYNLGLRRRKALRFESEQVRRGADRDLDIAGTSDGRDLVLRAVESRALGDLDGSREALMEALKLEPSNTRISDQIDAIDKLLMIVKLQERQA
ncbi:MAG: response regulator [Myxococcales bacterium]|nr:response regulator [Myxococcales bacterium]